ncbi:Hypothetical predicted protein [Mytilus galloprovincialis]|uniref:Uncharacterized protein n=1 Tax=Mytilus galloprovincialis TaxID=29158 RepID=A0A8B6ELT6_MYTGA|nr:Hypothetical predicted protein [Mytilus galloprovincialis]
MSKKVQTVMKVQESPNSDEGLNGDEGPNSDEGTNGDEGPNSDAGSNGDKGPNISIVEGNVQAN